MEATHETARFNAFTLLGDAEREVLIGLAGRKISLKRGQYLRREGELASGCYLLLSGWAGSSVMFSDGSRLILKVHTPGDMMGSPSMALMKAAESIVAFTPAVVTVLSLEAIGSLFETSPRLAAVLYLISQEERVALIDRLASVGRSSALGSVATIILQIHSRLQRNDPSIGDSFAVPLTQADIADLVGLTTIHVNRTLQTMREDKVLQWNRGIISIEDPARLRQIADLPRRELTHDLDWLPGSGRSSA